MDRRTILKWRGSNYVFPAIAEMADRASHPVVLRLPDNTLLSVVSTSIPYKGDLVANVVEVTVLDAKPIESE
jgi:hypothetical protein